MTPIDAGNSTPPPKVVTVREAIEYAANALEREEVQYAMGIDTDHLDFSFVRGENGEPDRPRTEADLAEEQAEVDGVITTLRALAGRTDDTPRRLTDVERIRLIQLLSLLDRTDVTQLMAIMGKSLG